MIYPQQIPLDPMKILSKSHEIYEMPENHQAKRILADEQSKMQARSAVEKAAALADMVSCNL